MAISRSQLAKELEPGLNALFGLEYDENNEEYKELYSIEDSDRAFEEEVLVVGFGAAPVKEEGAGVNLIVLQKATQRDIHTKLWLLLLL